MEETRGDSVAEIATSTAASQVRSRQRHRRRVALLAITCSVAAAAVAFIAASALRPAPQLPTRVREPPVAVPIHRGVLASVVQATGSITRAAGNPLRILTPTLTSPGAQAIITAEPWRSGQTINDGELLVEVAGQPVFLLTGSLPAYRDLELGESGRDVIQLQRALQLSGLSVSDPPGSYGTSTAHAVAQLFARAGYRAPTSTLREAAPSLSGPSATGAPRQRSGADSRIQDVTGAMLPVWEVVYVPTLPATVTRVSATLGSSAVGRPILYVGRANLRAELTVDPNAAAALRPGMRVTLRSDSGARLSGSVASVASSNQSSGSVEVYVRLLHGAGHVHPGDSVAATITESTSSRPVWSVPADAIQTLPSGANYIELLRQGRRRTTPVSIGFTADGYVAVVPSNPRERLRSSDMVLIP